MGHQPRPPTPALYPPPSDPRPPPPAPSSVGEGSALEALAARVGRLPSVRGGAPILGPADGRVFRGQSPLPQTSDQPSAFSTASYSAFRNLQGEPCGFPHFV